MTAIWIYGGSLIPPVSSESSGQLETNRTSRQTRQTCNITQQRDQARWKPSLPANYPNRRLADILRSEDDVHQDQLLEVDPRHAIRKGQILALELEGILLPAQSRCQ